MYMFQGESQKHCVKEIDSIGPNLSYLYEQLEENDDTPTDEVSISIHEVVPVKPTKRTNYA